MAIKYYCDGCDRVVPYDDVQRMSVTIKTGGSTLSSGGEYELCNGCAASLVTQGDPTKWVRCRPMPQAAE